MRWVLSEPVVQRPVLGSCLTGIGGIDLGFKLAGWDIGWQVERDPFKLEVLKQAWPEVKKHEDLLKLDGIVTGPADCIAIDCPTHRYREERALMDAAMNLSVPWKPEFFLITAPCAVQFRDDEADWRPLKDNLGKLGYDVHSAQASCGHGPFWWERVFVIGHRRPLLGRLKDMVGKRMLFGDAEQQKDRTTLCYGKLDHGDIGQGERDFAFPKKWTCICSDRYSIIQCTSKARMEALRDAVCVDVAAWIGALLMEECLLLLEAQHAKQ